MAALLGLGTHPVHAQDDAARLHLGGLQLHVFYKDSGRLSPDLLHGDGPRATWNLTIGGGGLEEPADHALVVIPIRADKDARGSGEVYSNLPIVVRVRAGRKTIAQRTFAGVLTSDDGRAHEALWLPDVTCAGPIVIEAAMGRERQLGEFDFRCGE